MVMKQETNSKELLHYLLSCDNIQVDEVLDINITMKEIMTQAKKELLKKHPYEIYNSKSENAWRTYVSDISKPNKRRAIKRKSKEDIESYLISYYLEQVKNETLTLANAYEQWVIFRRDSCSVKTKTIRENMNDWNRFYKDSELASMHIKDIMPVTLIRFFRNLTKNRTYTYKQISNMRSVLNGIFSWAIEQEFLQHNPLSDVNFKTFSYKPVEEQTDNVFSHQDAITLLTYLAKIVDEPYSLAIQLFFNLFIRIGELKALCWDDIDWDKKTIYLHQQVLLENDLNDDLTFSSRKVVVSDRMKGATSKGYRKEFLNPSAIEILMKARKLNPNGKFIFEPDGKPMSTDRFNRRLRQYCNGCGVNYHSSHKIRFYCASTAYDGQNLTTISKFMGHSQVATTLNYLRNVDKGTDSIQAFENLGLGSKSE